MRTKRTPAVNHQWDVRILDPSGSNYSGAESTSRLFTLVETRRSVTTELGADALVTDRDWGLFFLTDAQ